MNTPPMVSIILLNWNQHALTAACLDSLRKTTYAQKEVIIVDQASTDGSVEYFERNYPEAILIANSANTGFTGGNNQGMKRASGDYFLVLNNDTEVEPDFLEPLILAADHDEHVGACGPLIRYHAHPEYVQYAGGPRSIDLMQIGRAHV